MGARSDIDRTPAQFTAAVELIRQAVLRPEVVVDEMPAPQRIAPHAFAISGDVLVGEDELATGRFILLHDPAGNDAWGGTFRCVTFARADIEADMAISSWSYSKTLVAQRGVVWCTIGANIRLPTLGTVRR